MLAPAALWYVFMLATHPFSTPIHTHTHTHSCGRRMLTLQNPDGLNLSKTEACKLIAEQYPEQCSLCHPDTCPERAPLHCGCDDCDEEVGEVEAGKFRCVVGYDLFSCLVS